MEGMGGEKKLGLVSLCQRSHPTLSHLHSFHLAFAPNVAHTTFGGPPPLNVMKQVPYTLSPPKRVICFPMLYHFLGLLGVLVYDLALMVPGHLIRGCVLFPRCHPIFFKLD